MVKSSFIGCALFISFLAYFSFTSYHLPDTAGPDEILSSAAADFYYEHNRMATVAGDEDKMKFSDYGDTRLLRPPLGFYLPSLVAKTPGLTDLDRKFQYRLSSALLGALTLLVCFLILKLYFNNPYYAFFGAVLVGLIPQFTFYSSYINDDAAAIFCSALMCLSMVNIYKNGSSTKACAFFAFAVGLTVLTKETAWIFIGTAIVFYGFYILRFNKQFWVQHAWMILAFIVGGGWWLLFNMYHYGIGEFMLSDTKAALSAKHAEFDLEGFGFMAVHGLGMHNLLIGNQLQFIDATYEAFIGFLDWLKLQVGPFQYNYYLWVVAAVELNAVFLLGYTANLFFFKKGVSEKESYQAERRRIGFEWLLYLAIIIQVLLFTWHNVYKDIQIQGKYLMPVLMPLTILAFSAIDRVMTWSKSRFSFDIPKPAKVLVFFLICASPVIVHLDALVNYVIPFYWPDMEVSPFLSWL